MSKGWYFGVDGKARKVKKLYIGIDGKARKVKKVYFGVDGKARLCYSSGAEAGQVTFTSSQVWTVPDGVTKVTVFLVGGGGGGSGAYYEYYTSGATYQFCYGGVGGSGGNTTTATLTVKPNEKIAITIGAGGEGGKIYINNQKDSISIGSTSECRGKDGGTTSFGSYASALGGLGGAGTQSGSDNYNVARGSGGGWRGGTRYDSDYGETYLQYPGCGGSDGSNGYATDGVSSAGQITYSATLTKCDNVKGQGTTTREFGDSAGTLYAGGGGGGGINGYPIPNSSYPNIVIPTGGAGGGGNGGYCPTSSISDAVLPTAGKANTGGGGGGALLYYTGASSVNYACNNGAKGGSGIVIVKWDKQGD